MERLTVKGSVCTVLKNTAKIYVPGYNLCVLMNATTCFKTAFKLYQVVVWHFIPKASVKN
jgi:hypothetical protein